MKKIIRRKTDPKNVGKKHSKPLLKLIHRHFSRKSKEGRSGGEAMAPTGSPVSLGRKISDMTWEKARGLASRENHLWF